jgi:hypothetical protein
VSISLWCLSCPLFIPPRFFVVAAVKNDDSSSTFFTSPRFTVAPSVERLQASPAITSSPSLLSSSSTAGSFTTSDREVPTADSQDLQTGSPTSTSSTTTSKTSQNTDTTLPTESLTFSSGFPHVPSSSMISAPTLSSSSSGPSEHSTNDSAQHQSLSRAQITGIVLGVLFALSLLLFLYFRCLRRRLPYLGEEDSETIYTFNTPARSVSRNTRNQWWDQSISSIRRRESIASSLPPSPNDGDAVTSIPSSRNTVIHERRDSVKEREVVQILGSKIDESMMTPSSLVPVSTEIPHANVRHVRHIDSGFRMPRPPSHVGDIQESIEEEALEIRRVLIDLPPEYSLA